MTPAAAPTAVPLGPTATLTDASAENTGARLLILAIVALGAGLLAAAAIPTSALPHSEIRHLVHDRRPDLALLGVATLGLVGVVYLAVHVAS